MALPGCLPRPAAVLNKLNTKPIGILLASGIKQVARAGAEEQRVERGSEEKKAMDAAPATLDTIIRQSPAKPQAQ